ncbi:MAG: transglutaminase family protein, partial [Rhodospirillales bacterium]|nr:transglutaminase family protein [Rhodospirillales bacterium]
MTTRVSVEHRTAYHFDRPVGIGAHTVRLRPAPHCRTPITGYSLRVEPANHFVNWQQDAHGNHVARLVFPEPATDLTITVSLVAEMTVINPFDFFVESYAERSGFAYPPELAQDLEPYLRPVGDNPLLTAWLADHPELTAPGQAIVGFLIGLNRQIAGDVAYSVRMEPGVLTPEQTLGGGKGSCRDSAWLLVQMLRHLGYAARFVSGYLIQLAPDVKPLEGPPGPEADFTDLHAWAEVYLPGAGWGGLDATSRLFCGAGHIPLAASPDPISAAPITGMVEKAEVTFDFEMSVRRIRETPRTTKPYAEATWQAILARGAEVDRALARGAVRLTMGGEPTFVSASDMDAPEWNTAALGPTKQVYAERLIRRLIDRWSPGAVLQHGMGKQYPGEQLPRWALLAHWRADGEPVWRDRALLASVEDRDDATARDAATFAARLAERLQVDPALVIPAHEDTHYYLWKEHRLPANVLAEESKLRDPMERARLSRVFGQGLGAAVGSVLPLRRVIRDGARRWQSGQWFFRAGELFLIPGDSPIGLRLPLESLPWVSDEDLEVDVPPDPFAPKPPLPSAQAMRVVDGPGAAIERFRPVPQDLPVVGESDPSV